MRGTIPKLMRTMRWLSVSREDYSSLLDPGESVSLDGFAARSRHIFGGDWGRIQLTSGRLLFMNAPLKRLSTPIQIPISAIKRIEERTSPLTFPRLRLSLVDGRQLSFYWLKSSEVRSWSRALEEHPRRLADVETVDPIT